MRSVLLLLIALVASSCTPNPVVGKWKVTQTYDPVRRELKPVVYEGFLEVSRNGSFKIILPDGTQRTGEYKLDEAANPDEFTATEKNGRTVRGTYRVAGDVMEIRVVEESPDSDFPATEIDSDDTNRGLIKFERKKE